MTPRLRAARTIFAFYLCGAVIAAIALMPLASSYARFGSAASASTGASAPGHAAREAFDLADQDSDGRLDPAEFVRALDLLNRKR